MSIHVTVNTDPPCVRRRGLMFSDLEQIKKYERGRRRRLRLEQVRQQSKNIASKILEQTKNITKKELNNLENNDNSKLKRMHEEKLMEIQRRYQEDMDEIGLAHESALAQPNADAIINEKKCKNQLIANERGKEATKRLKESTKINDNINKQQERLRQVREIEDIRSSMIANLPKKISTIKHKDIEQIPTTSSAAIEPYQSSLITEHTTTVSRKSGKQSPKKRIGKKIRGKLSLNKSPKSKISTNNSKKSSSPQQINIVTDQDNKNELNSHDIEYNQVPCYSQCYRKSDSDSGKIASIQLSSVNKGEKSLRYNPSDYQNDIYSSNHSSINSIITDDSSYFSDRQSSTVAPIISDDLSTSKHHSSIANSEIKLYDHKTREKTVYNHPEGLVERENIKSIPNATEMARKIIEIENNNPNKMINQRLIAKKRGNDAILREKVRRDYDNLMNNLDHLSREERKLKSTQINNSINCNNYINKSRRKQLNDARQRKLDRAYEIAIDDIHDNDQEAIITLHSKRQSSLSDKNNDIAWENPPFDVNNELSREEQILEMLKKVERQKRLLLHEFGATLPNDVLSASMTPLFTDNKNNEQSCCNNIEAKSTIKQSPEIKVINMSQNNGKKSQKSKKKIKKKLKIITQSPTGTSEIAVQTQSYNEIDKNINGKDKSIQVELSTEKVNNSLKNVNDTKKSDIPEHIEPVVTIITHSNSDISSTASSNHGVVINVNHSRVDITPKNIETRSLPSSKSTSPIKRLSIDSKTSISAPASRAVTPDQNYHDTTDDSSISSTSTRTNSSIDERKNLSKQRINANTMTTEYSRVTKLSVGTDNLSSDIQLQHGDVSINKPYLMPRRRIKYKERSDTSTSYASLPPAVPQRHNDDGIVSNISSILELVDSSTNETINRMRANVSPVSTPETPSPRTIRIPSNIPNIEKITRILKFNDRINTDNNEQNIHEREILNQRRVIRKIPIYQHEICTCPSSNHDNNNEQVNNNSNNDDDNDYEYDNDEFEALKHEEELQNSCTEKIASLTALIDKLRDEKRDIESSMFAPSDDTTLMQLPAPKLMPGSRVQELQNLVESIELIHDELVKTMAESGNKLLMNNNGKIDEFMLSPVDSSEVSPVINDDDSKRKPRIVSDELVHLDLRRIRRGQDGIQTIKIDETYQRNNINDNNIVEKLSQEILEQSKNVGMKDLSGKNPDKNDQWSKNELGFTPVLADIPKISNKSQNTSAGNGQYRTETKFIRQELSTIDELDTTDTATRSYMSGNHSPKKQQRTPSTRQINNKHASTSNQETPTNNENYSTPIQKSPINNSENNDKQQQRNDNNTGENLSIEKSIKSPDSFLTYYSTRNIGGGDFFDQINIENAITSYETKIKCEKKLSNSSNSLSGFSGISHILTTSSSASSDIITSQFKTIESQLEEMGLLSLIPIAKKTREASALSSSSNSDTTLTINKRTKSSMKKLHDGNSLAILDFSDVSSISIREASKSTERTVLMKARTSTPNIQNYNYTSEKSSLTTTSGTSGKSLQDYSDSLASKILAIH